MIIDGMAETPQEDTLFQVNQFLPRFVRPLSNSVQLRYGVSSSAPPLLLALPLLTLICLLLRWLTVMMIINKFHPEVSGSAPPVTM